MSEAKKNSSNTVMTAHQKIQWLIYNCAARISGGELNELPYPYKDIDVVSREGIEAYPDYFTDGRNIASCEGVETGIDSPYAGYFENESRAHQFPDGTWVGWTRWYGGGKHACPSNIPWEDDVCPVSCKEEQVTIIKRTFTKDKE